MGWKEVVGKLIGVSSQAPVLDLTNVVSSPRSSNDMGTSNQALLSSHTYPPQALRQNVRPVGSSSADHGYFISAAPYYDLCDEMVDVSQYIGMCIELITAYALMRPRSIQPARGYSKHPQMSKALDLIDSTFFDIVPSLTEQQGNDRFIRALWALFCGVQMHGRSNLELVWDFDEDRKLFYPCRILHAHPGQFGFTRDGLMYLLQIGASGKVVHPLKFLSVVSPALYDNPFGWSSVWPLRHEYWFAKRLMIAALSEAENGTTPFLHGKVDKEATDKAIQMQNLSEKLIRLKSTSVLVTGNDESIEAIKRSTGSSLSGGSTIHSALMDRFESYAVRRLLGAELTTKGSKYGTQALGGVQERTVLNKVMPICWFVMEPVSWLFNVFLLVNLGSGAPRVRFAIDTEEATDAQEARETLECAVKNGVPVAVAEAQTRLGFRPPLPGEPVLKAKPEQETIPPVESPEEPQDAEPGFALKPKSLGKECGFIPFAEYSYCSTQFDLSGALGGAMVGWAKETIMPDDLHPEYGIEMDSHVTLLYGLAPETKVEDVKKACAGHWPTYLEFGPFGVFSREDSDYDVLYVTVQPEPLKKLRECMEGLPHTKTHPTYIPHMTVAYLKKGMGEHYLLCHCPISHEWQYVDKLTFCDMDGNKTKIQLTGPEVDFTTPDIRRVPGSPGMPTGFEFITQRLEGYDIDTMSSLWHAEAESASQFRETHFKRTVAAEEKANELVRRIADQANMDAKPRLAVSFNRFVKELRKNPDAALTAEAIREFDDSALDFRVEARRVVLSTFMVATWVKREELRYVRSKEEKKSKYKRFAEEDLISLLPEEFQDAAEWMASRGVMTVEAVKELAEAMQAEFGGTLKDWERQLRDQYLALAGTADTGATIKIREMIADAVEQGLTQADFVEQLVASLGIGDLPGGTDTYIENVFRTEVANAYSEAQKMAEERPDFARYHWGWQAYNPADANSRPGHAKTKNRYFKKDSPASRILGRPPYSYQCRCSIFPLTDPDPETATYKESPDALSVAMQVEKF